jgi:hypothetical protein
VKNVLTLSPRSAVRRDEVPLTEGTSIVLTSGASQTLDRCKNDKEGKSVENDFLFLLDLETPELKQKD